MGLPASIASTSGRGRHSVKRRSGRTAPPKVLTNLDLARAALCTAQLLLVGLHSVKVVNLHFPLWIRHVRPVVFIESWSSLKGLFTDIEDELLVLLIEGECSPWNRKEFVTHPKKSTVRQHGVGYPATRRIEHDFVDGS